MGLNKDDLREIRSIVKEEITGEVQGAKNEIISLLGREISDLAEINHAVIEQVDKIPDLEERVVRVEQKAGIVS